MIGITIKFFVPDEAGDDVDAFSAKMSETVDDILKRFDILNVTELSMKHHISYKSQRHP